jgi:hypothetical protein
MILSSWEMFSFFYSPPLYSVPGIKHVEVDRKEIVAAFVEQIL